MQMPEIAQTILIDAPAQLVWDSLTRTELMTQWMGDSEMAVEVETDWVVGKPIVVRGFHHVRFQNIGVVLEFNPIARLVYTHLSSLSRLPDEPGSYTTLEFNLRSAGAATSLDFLATGFPTESIFKHLQFYWGGTLQVLKQTVERRLS